MKNNSFVRGKNKLIYTVADQFLNAFIKKEIDFLKSGNSIEVVGLEKNLTREISVDGIDFPIKLIGNADRIDKVNGQLRIIDYKTGKVEPKEVQADDVRKITQETQFQKGFQLFLYAYMYKRECYDQDLEAGIVSFRALKKGFFPAAIKQEKNKNSIFSDTLSDTFEEELKSLLKELFDPNIPFSHADRSSPCRFCDPEKFLS